VGQGLYSEFNGGVALTESTANGNGDNFKLAVEHLQPEQVVKSRFAGDWFSLDNFSNVTGRINDAQESNLLELGHTQALPGCGIRFYVPFDAAAIRLNVSWFFSVARFFGLVEANAPSAVTSSNAQKHHHHGLHSRTQGRFNDGYA
jgi:outer membrane protein assembly factor BamA